MDRIDLRVKWGIEHLGVLIILPVTTYQKGIFELWRPFKIWHFGGDNDKIHRLHLHIKFAIWNQVNDVCHIPKGHFLALWRPLSSGYSLLEVAKLSRTCFPKLAHCLQKKSKSYFIVSYFSHPFLFQTFCHLFRRSRCLFFSSAGSTLLPGISPWSPDIFQENIVTRTKYFISRRRNIDGFSSHL